MLQPAGYPPHTPINFRVRPRWLETLILVIATFSTWDDCRGGTKSRLVEVGDGTFTRLGKIVAKDADGCFLMDRFGVMAELPIRQLKSFRVVSESFRPSSTSEFRQQLMKEFSAGYEVTISARYVVCGRKGRTQIYSQLFEEIYRQIDAFYSLRGFDTDDPDMALVAIVFANQEEFRAYCERDQMAWSDTLRGYYSLRTNRVVLYDDPTLLNSVTAVSRPRQETSSFGLSEEHGTPHGSATTQAFAFGLPEQKCSCHDGLALFNSLAGETAGTIIHETTHQVGFNIGIHSRVGETPVWLVEGLATVLEAPGMRTRGKSPARAMINDDRLNWFAGEYESRRKPGDLARMIASDDMFRNEALDAYSLAWALTYFLTENPARARQFVDYLKTVSQRDPMPLYTAQDRLQDFHSAFGDIARLEVDLLRSIDRVISP